MRNYAWLLIFLITACTPEIAVEPPPQSPKPFRMVISSSLRPQLENSISQCIAETPGIGLMPTFAPRPSIKSNEADILIQLGEPQDGFSGGIYQLGEEEIQLLANPRLDISTLYLKKIQTFFTMQSPTDIQTLTYPAGHEYRILFDDVFLKTESISPYSQIIPNAAAMLDAIAATPQSIGYAPVSYGTGGNQVIPIDSEFQNKLRLPILALTPQEPSGILESYLICLQQNK